MSLFLGKVFLVTMMIKKSREQNHSCLQCVIFHHLFDVTCCCEKGCEAQGCCLNTAVIYVLFIVLLVIY